MSESNSAKLSWKRAFHILKCVALKKFRIKYHEKLDLYQTVITPEQDNQTIKQVEKKVIYPRKVKPTIEWSQTTYNDSLDKLAQTVISGIVEEIKSRSSSSSDKSPPKSPKVISQVQKTKEVVIPEKKDKSKIEIISKNFKKTKYDKPFMDINNFKPKKTDQKNHETVRPPPSIRQEQFKEFNKKNERKSFFNISKDKIKLEKKKENQKNSNILNANLFKNHQPSLKPIYEANIETKVDNQLNEISKKQKSQLDINSTTNFVNIDNVQQELNYKTTISIKDGDDKVSLIESENNSDPDKVIYDKINLNYESGNESKFDHEKKNLINQNNEQKNNSILQIYNKSESNLTKDESSAEINEEKKSTSSLNDQNKPIFLPDSDLNPNESSAEIDGEKKSTSSLNDQNKPIFLPDSDLNPNESSAEIDGEKKSTSSLNDQNKPIFLPDSDLNPNESSAEIDGEKKSTSSSNKILEQKINIPNNVKEENLPLSLDTNVSSSLDKLLNQIAKSFDNSEIEDNSLNLDNFEEEKISLDKSITTSTHSLSLKDKKNDNNERTVPPELSRTKKTRKNSKISSPILFSYKKDNAESSEDTDSENEKSPENENNIIMSDETKFVDVPNDDETKERQQVSSNEQPVNEESNQVDAPDQTPDPNESVQEQKPVKTEKPKKPKKIETPKLNEDFFYDYESMIFKPVISEESNLTNNFLQLFHSFGYDCKKRSNLFIIDEETLIFSAGSLVQLVNIRTREQRYLNTLSGGAVGAISVHPSRQFFAIGEKGNVPNINIYAYPSLKLYRILRQGTIKGYAFLDYDPSGNLLASLGSSPDYMLTIWDWREEKIVLRTKAFSQDIFKVTFSKDLEGTLTSAGTGHIKFWKMAKTFTGFKLQGDIGKFGKTEISDIEGYAELPDGKVLSGSEWGNMLLWDESLIQTEICRKKNKTCHMGTIQQITLNEGDIYTIGDDGSIRVWDFETIDTSEPSEEGVKLEIEPLNELKVGNNVALKSMVKDINEDSTFWYAQDSNGAIWKIDLGFSATSEDPRKLFNYHAGCINGIECCPISHLFATTADDGSVKIYDYTNFEILCQKNFSKGGTSLKWLDTTIDPDGGTIAAGFKDGVVRFLKLIQKSDKYELAMFEVFKPHTDAITQIAFDSKKELFATGSDDKTVFFFSNKQNTRSPIGFVNLPSKVTYMTWTPADYIKNRLLVCMENGAVHEYEAPVPGSYDISKTYLIELSLKHRKYQFKSIKSFLRHEEELERKRIEEEERLKKEMELKRLRGVDEEEEKKKKKAEEKKAEEAANLDDEESNESKPKEDEWKPFIPETPSKICWALYSSQDTFWLSMDDYDAGYLYECKFVDEAQKSKISPEKIDEPIRGIPVIKSDLTHSEDIPLTCMIFDKTKKYCVMGEKNGVLRVSPMEESKKMEDSKHFWSLGYHDNDYGHVTNVCLSYDEKFLFSIGADSNIFGILFNSSMEDLDKARKEKIRVVCRNEVKEIADIDDPSAYSIEQTKQKSEYDKMIAIAESKKADMRQKINGLRKLFKDLTIKNDQLVPRLRLSKDEFMLEETIKQHVINQINEKIDITYRELAWQSEKCRLMLDKVQSKFKDVIDCDHIVVHSFDKSINVATFRTVGLPKDMEAYKSELEIQYFAKLLEKQKTKENLDAQGILEINNDEADNNLLQGPSIMDQMKKIFGKLRGNTAAKVERALRKMDERRNKRIKRKQEWQELMKSKLPDEYENPDDLANIKNAEETIGDFKLKSSDNYVVSENDRMNVFKAVERLMMIKKIINNNQMIFNRKVINLRDKKKQLVDEINKAIDRLEQIYYILDQDQVISIQRPVLHPEEIPEKKYEYTREKLIEFKKELDARQNKVQEDESGSSGGFGGFGGPAQNKKVEIKHTEKKANFDGIKKLWHNKETMSRLMIQSAQIKEIRLHYEQKQIIKSIEEKIQLFDAELKLLRHDKAHIAIHMKKADLRHVTIFEEFLLLKDFEKTENDLEQKLSLKKDEHLEMQAKLSEIQSKIDIKKKDIDKLDEGLKLLYHNFVQMIHDESKYGDFLNKVYKRKIKRKKKAEGAEEEEESEEESEDEDDDDEDDDFDDDDSEAEGREQLDLDICPSGLKQELYDQVCQLREKRLDYEEQIAEEKRIFEQFKKDQDGLIKKGKIVENGLRQVQQELENFQKEKQKKINDLDIVVILRMAQIQYLNKGRLPSDLSQSLAFDSLNLERLHTRIKELEAEKASEKKLFKNLKERHVELIRDKKKMDEYVGRLDELCNKMMIDKYGKIVDLEKIELIAVNQQIEELKQKMAENEFEHEKVMREWLEKINSEKDESIELMKANTTRINEMVELLTESKKLESMLDNKQRSLGQEMTSTSKKDLEERRRLHTLVQLQAQEIEALKAEISILSRKGGHILPPTQPSTITQS